MKPVLKWQKRSIRGARGRSGTWWFEADIRGLGVLEVWPMLEPERFRVQIPALGFQVQSFDSRERAMIAAEKHLAAVADSINAALSRKTS